MLTPPSAPIYAKKEINKTTVIANTIAEMIFVFDVCLIPNPFSSLYPIFSTINYITYAKKKQGHILFFCAIDLDKFVAA